MVREEHREHMVQDKGACGDKYERGNQGSRARTEMKGRVQVIHKDQDRDLETGTREGRILCPRKGILRGIWRRG